jgi:hypothetical protein
MTALMARPPYVPGSLDTGALADFSGAFTPARGDRTSSRAIAWPRATPLQAVSAAGAILALTFAYGLMRLPVQMSDSFEQLVSAQQSPSVLAEFVARAQQGAYLRPMFYAEVKALFDLSNGHYWLVYRGFHALLLCLAVGLFIRALRVRTWDHFAAAIFALTVFTGLHTFRGLVREAFPVPHFLQVAVLCLLALNLARSRGGWMVDVAAAATFVVASLTLESGLLVWVVAATAWACGMRGVSRRGLVAMTVLLGVYCLVRFWLLSVGTPGFNERSSGFLLSMLEPDEIQQRFGSYPGVFYAYNVVTSFLSVLFSEPDGGVFEGVRAWMAGDVPPRLYLAVASSCLTTGLIAWVIAARVRGGLASMRDELSQLLIVSTTVIIANAAMSYVYTKHEIMSVAGCFYAVAAFVAGRHALDWLRREAPAAARIAVVIVLASCAALWAFRSIGVYHMLRVEAFKVRNDWARMPAEMPVDDGSPSARQAAALFRQLRHDAVTMPVSNPYMVPRWVDRWWGE